MPKDLDPLPITKLSLPRPAVWIGGFVLYPLALLITFTSLQALFALFQEFWKIGLGLFLTGIGEFIYFGPAVAAWGGPSWLIQYAEEAPSKQKMWKRAVLGFLLVALGPFCCILPLSDSLGYSRRPC